MCLDSTVFLIDDDAAVRDALSISLSLADLKNEVYSSGKAFLDAYTGDRPGCLLMNLSQPEEKDGLTVQQELIRRNFSIPIIFMTGIGTIRRDSVPAMQPGVFCLLEKPFPRSLLLDSVRKAIEQDRDNRSDIKTQDETDDYADYPQLSYKQLSPRKKEIMALISPEKSGKLIEVMLEIALRTSALYWAHLTEIGAQFTLCAGLFYPTVQLF